MSELDNILSAAIELAEISSRHARNAWFGDVAVTYKADGSSLTEADLSIYRGNMAGTDTAAIFHAWHTWRGIRFQYRSQRLHMGPGPN